jgi:ribosome-associated heat shock protein Hsp15
MEQIIGSVRIDKWMWAARFFKTRALASEACEAGRIEANGQRAKASREVKVGTMLRVSNEAGEFHVEVLVLSEVRGPAAVAQTMYRETEESRELRVKVAAERKVMMETGGLSEGRPTKQDRRALSRLRGRIHPF